MALSMELRLLSRPSKLNFGCYDEVTVCSFTSKTRGKGRQSCVLQSKKRTASTHNGNFQNQIGNGNHKSLNIRYYVQYVNLDAVKKAVKNWKYIGNLRLWKASNDESEHHVALLNSGQPESYESHEENKAKPEDVKEESQSSPEENQSTPPPFVTLNKPLHTLYSGKSLTREQHKFHEAMMDKYESISSYNSSDEKYAKAEDKEKDFNSNAENSQQVDLEKAFVEQTASAAQPSKTAIVATTGSVSETSSGSRVSVFVKGTLSAATTAIWSAISVPSSYMSIPTFAMFDTMKKYQTSKLSTTPEKIIASQEVSVSKKQLEKRTIGLSQAFIKAKTDSSRSVRLEELCVHLVMNPDFTSVVLRVSAHAITHIGVHCVYYYYIC